MSARGSTRVPQDDSGPPVVAPTPLNGHSWWCPQCKVKLTGSTTCHCSLCHRTFSGPTGFDAHQPGKCIDVTTLLFGPNHAHAGKPRYLSARRTGQGFDYPVVVSANYDHQHRTGDAHDAEAGH